MGSSWSSCIAVAAETAPHAVARAFRALVGPCPELDGLSIDAFRSRDGLWCSLEVDWGPSWRKFAATPKYLESYLAPLSSEVSRRVTADPNFTLAAAAASVTRQSHYVSFSDGAILSVFATFAISPSGMTASVEETDGLDGLPGLSRLWGRNVFGDDLFATFYEDELCVAQRIPIPHDAGGEL